MIEIPDVRNNSIFKFVHRQFVNFKIIRRTGRGNVYRWWSFGISAFFMLFMLVFGEIVPGNVMAMMFLVMIALLFFFVIKLQLLKEHDELGWIMMATDYLVVKINNEEIEYALDNSTKMLLEFRGYAGEPVIGQWIGDKKGYYNFISLTDNQGTKKYEVLVSNKMKISILERLIVYYRGLGMTVKHVDKSSDDSKKSLILRLLLAMKDA